MRLYFACVGTVAMATALLCTTTSFAQQDQGTPEQRAACAPDAFRLCSSYILDPASVEACLRQKTAALSEACRSVFAQGSAPQNQMIDSRRSRE